MNQIEKAISAILKTSLAEKEKGNAILAILATSEESQTSSTIPKKHHKNPPQETFVYLIGNSEGHTKIGFSGNPEKRLKQLKTACPSARIKYKFLGTYKEEQYLQKYFYNKKIVNEWFLLDRNDIEIINNFFQNKNERIKANEIIINRGDKAGDFMIQAAALEPFIDDGSFFNVYDNVSVPALIEAPKTLLKASVGMGQTKAQQVRDYFLSKGKPMSKAEWKDKEVSREDN